MSPMFVPGPVDVDAKVLAAQAKPMLPHRSKDFEAMFASTGEKLKQVFFTEHRVFQGTHSGSGMQEMAVRNLAEKSVLACVNGAFASALVRCGRLPTASRRIRSKWSGARCSSPISSATR